MQSNEELFRFVEMLRDHLAVSGRFEEAERLKNALHISSVNTEVFMALRQALTRLLQFPEIIGSSELERRALEAKAAIDRALM